ncbi:MAG: RNA polymerase subunit sigma [Epulopiscium sp. Nele67-Bin005]|nr:MAG: RNA polymerase subunit sigma [Epulopiscium sp. Nele67-Bin005]
MDEKEVSKLWSTYRQNASKETKQALIAHYAQLVKIVAGRLGIYLNNYVEVDDLMGYGVIGLIDAIDKFDHEKQVKFETYASLRIRGAIIDEIRKLDWVPRTLRKKQKDLTKKCLEMEAEFGRPPTQEEVMKALEINEEEYFRLMQETNINTLISIDEHEGYVGSIKDEATQTPDQQIQRQELMEILRLAIESLSEREQLVIKLYYFEELTLKEISHILEVSESRVSQLHTNSIKKLRPQLHKYNLSFPL